MKRIKIMLTTMIVLGAVGGVFASKVNRTKQYCTRSTVNGVCPAAAKCPNGITNRKLTTTGGAVVCYVETDDATGCNADTPCTTFGRIGIN